MSQGEVVRNISVRIRHAVCDRCGAKSDPPSSEEFLKSVEKWGVDKANDYQPLPSGWSVLVVRARDKHVLGADLCQSCGDLDPLETVVEIQKRRAKGST